MGEIGREEWDARIDTVGTWSDARFAEAQARTDPGFSELKKLILAQDAKMQEAAGLIKWVVGAGLIAATVMVAVMALVFSSAMPKPQQPLIIITIPMPAQAVNAQ